MCADIPPEHSSASCSSADLASPEPRPQVLLVDDEKTLLQALRRMLSSEGYRVATAENAKIAIDLARDTEFDVIVSDIMMPGMNGLDLLRRVREHDLDVPVVLMTAVPDLETAMAAVELGAFRYLAKPVEMGELFRVVERAVGFHRMATLKRQALDLVGDAGKRASDIAGLEATFAGGIDLLWIAYQPIVCWSAKDIFGFEALLRTGEPSIPHPGEFFNIAERLGKVLELGRAIRRTAASAAASAPASTNLFVNLHPQDLLDSDLYAADGSLAPIVRIPPIVITSSAAS